MVKADKDTLKKMNKQLILSKLRNGNLSRTELAESTNLSHSTVSNIVLEMVNEGIIYEVSVAESSGGRKPIILSINPTAACTLLIIITKKIIRASLTDLKSNIIYEKSCEANIYDNISFRESILNILDIIINENKTMISKIVGIGISIPGLIDHSTEKIIYSSILGVKNLNIKEIITEKLKKPIYIFKDTDALMLGESKLNNFSKYKSYIYVWVDTGVGLSFMLNGNLLELKRSGLQIGHIKFQPNGPKCSCGKKGCVESFISESAVLRELKKRAKSDSFNSYDEIDKMRLIDIVNESNKGNKLCKKVLSMEGEYLGRLIGDLLNLFAPDMVLIGGPLSNIEWDIHKIIKGSMLRNALDIFRDTEIKFTSTGYKSCFIGMSERILEKEFYTK